MRTTKINLTKTKIKTSKKVYIPPFYELNYKVLGKENYRLVSKDGKLSLYVSPLIRTLLNQINEYTKSGDTLGKIMKERMCSNSRLLLKKSVNSKEIKIMNQSFIRVDRDIFIENNKMFIMND